MSLDGATNAQSKTNTGDEQQLLTFIVDGSEYAVDILRVQEIRSWSTPMPIPNTPSFIKGVINLRGEVVAIADLRERLGLPNLAYGPATVVVVLHVKAGGRDRVMGIIVDAMSDVTNVLTSTIKPPPVFQQSGDASLAKGIVTLENKMITILDVDRVFDGSGTAVATA
jgi:purine-binding chemotaxis protein CheW